MSVRRSRLRSGRPVGWFAALAALAFSLLFIGSAVAAPPVYGIATGKQCPGPLNVGDAYACTASISNTNSSSEGTVTASAVQDQVFHPDGTTAGGPQTVLINSTTVAAGSVHLVDDGIAPAPSCDATKCTIPFGDQITVDLSHYTVQPQDVGSSVLGQNTLSDIANFSYRQVCDKPVDGFPCSTGLNISGSGAATDVNPIPTSTTTEIHNNAGGGAVTSVPEGTTVHDFVTVTGVPGQPGPAGTVDVQWFTNGGCTQPFATHKIETLVPDAGGGFSTVDATDFPQGPLVAGHYSFQANYLGDGNTPSQFAPSQGGCEPLTVVPPENKGIIAPTQTTCTDFTSGTAPTLGQVNYSVTGGGKIGQGINPGVFFYYTKITTTVANQVVTVGQSNTSTNNTPLFGILNGQAWLYPADCSSHVVGTTTGANDSGASFTVPTPGTYIIGIKYQTKTIAGAPAPVPMNITYNFTTSLGGSTGGSVLLKKQ